MSDARSWRPMQTRTMQRTNRPSGKSGLYGQMTVRRQVTCFCLVLLAFIAQAPPPASPHKNSVSAMMEAEECARALVPVLWRRKETFPTDPQMLLGVAVLAEQFAPSPMYFENNADLYRRVLEIEPENRAAMAALARHTVTRFVANLHWPLMTLETMRQHAERDNLEEVMLPSYSDLFKWFGQKGKAFVMIPDLDEARTRIIREQSRDLPSVRAVLDEGRRLDPNNALYDYLDGQLDFELSRDGQALSKIENGSRKSKLNHYVDELAAARRKVLEYAETPQEYIATIDWMESLRGPSVSTDKVLRMANDRVASGDAQGAASTYKLLIRIVDQMQEEGDRMIVGSKGTQERISAHLRRKATEGLSRVAEGE